MSLKAIVTKEEFDSLADVVKAEYTEQKDGKITLQVTPVEGLELATVTKLKEALSKERTNVEKAKQDLAKFKDLDPEAAREALAQVEEFKKMDPDAKVAEQLKVKEQQLREKFEADGKAIEKKFRDEADKLKVHGTSLESQLKTSMVDSAAARAIAEAKGSADLLLPHVQKACRVKLAEDGKASVEILDAHGNPRLSTKPGSTDPMTIEEYVAEMKENTIFARAFDGTKSSGSGAGGSEKSNGSATAWTLTSQQALDRQKWMSADAAAKKAGQPGPVISDA